MIISISGKKQSGKDTVGKIIQKLHPEFEIKKFADKLKDIVCLLIECTREQLEQEDFKNRELGEEWDKIEKVFVGSSNASFPNAPMFFNKTVKMTPRLMLQLLGTEAGREIIHPDIWVNSLFSDYRKKDIWFDPIVVGTSGIRKSNWIITDTRFPNEADRVKKEGGILIRINREGLQYDNHTSETALDNYEGFDYVVDNNGSLEDLETKIKNILNGINR